MLNDEADPTVGTEERHEDRLADSHKRIRDGHLGSCTNLGRRQHIHGHTLEKG